METEPDAGTRRLGMIAAWTTVGLILPYVAALAIGFSTLRSPDAPIADPWFTIMELLILVMMPAMLLMMVAIHRWARAPVRHWTLAATLFTALLAGLTSMVHFPILALSRMAAFAGSDWAPLVFAFRWPSLAYALDILAWDVFFPLAALCASAAFGGPGLGRVIRVLLVASGLLALAGLIGVPTGDMGLRNIGIVGYAGVFPVAAGLIGMRFRGGGPG